jgi:Tfp pilus assembly protein PilN
MNAIVELLEKLDNFFKNKKSTEAYLFMALPIFVIGYIAYDYIIPATTKGYETSKSVLEKTEKEIVQFQSELNRLTVNGDKMYHVKILEKDINGLKTEIVRLDDASAYIDGQMVRISDILFNKKSWSLFLDSISQKAIDNKITVNTIENRFIDQKGEFGHVLEIGFEGSGSFTDMVNFLANIEKSELLVDVYGMDLQAEGPVKGAFKISVWGFSQ